MGDLTPRTTTEPPTLTLDNANGAVGDKWWCIGEPIPSQFVGDHDRLSADPFRPLTIDKVSGQVVTFHGPPGHPGATWLHVGNRFSLADRLNGAKDRLLASGMDSNPSSNGAETRAAVALLTRSVRIVSAGDTTCRPPTTSPTALI